MPTIVRWPAGIASIRTIHAVTHFTDWMPTLLAVADHRAARRLAGRRRRPAPAAARDRSGVRNPPRFWQWSRYEPTPFANAAVRDGDWKLRYPAVPELFDILPDDRVEERRLPPTPSRTDRRRSSSRSRHERRQGRPRSSSISPPTPASRFDVAARHPDRVGGMEEQVAGWYDSVEDERAALSGHGRDSPRRDRRELVSRRRTACPCAV